MKRMKMLSISLSAGLVLGAALVSWAVVPPPPVNQQLFIKDTKFPNITKADCLVCHVSDTELVKKHHALINTTTPPVSCYNTTSGAPTLATGCHRLISDGSGGFVLEDFRTCSNCHTSTPHHTTAAAAAQDCKFCHGKAIDNPLDGHYVPTYTINYDSTTGGVTPNPKGRQVVDPTTGKIVWVQGCRACHQGDPAATPPLFDNIGTHHGTGLGFSGTGQCTWCHTDQLGTLDIRACERCHGVKSLHNIQADSPNANNLGSIVPGQENLGYGHIGNNWDCQGCHASWFGNAGGMTTATAPSLNGQSAYSVTVGAATNLTLTGVGFMNVGDDGITVYKPVVTLTNGTTNLTIEPYSVTESEIKVLVPALAEGVYQLRVVKNGNVESNLAKLTAVPAVQVKSAVLGAKTVTITGKGFGAAPPTDYNSGLGVFVGDQQGKVISWSPDKIVASGAMFKAGSTVTVKTLYGPTSATITVATRKIR